MDSLIADAFSSRLAQFMPSNVALFEKLAYGAWAVGMLSKLLDLPRQSNLPHVRENGLLAIFAAMLFVFLLNAFFFWLIARRRKNWARWFLAVMVSLGTVAYLPQLASLIGANPLVAVLNLLSLVMLMLALYFVFTGNARPWFQKPVPAR